MGKIYDTIKSLHARLPQGVELVAVSKFHPAEAIREAYDAGQRLFGESRVQEVVGKFDSLPADIRWHFIGHLQTNKAKQLIGRVAMIESVDSERLLELIDRLSAERGCTTDVLLQVHVAQEETKFGFSPEELLAYFGSGAYRNLRATRIRGIMGMASNTDDMARVEADFALIASLKRQAAALAPDLEPFDVLSMGMSHDYPLAIAQGATHVRIGTAIFGERQY